MRIGHGFDVHVFADNRPLILGGVLVPYHKGLAAHSDGDVLLHALCDALLGAAGLGDIGHHFPDSDASYKDADSRGLVRQVVTLLQHNDLTVGNVDVTVIAQAPKLAKYIGEMRANIASDLNIAIARANVKATTTEQLGFTGRGEGIAAHAVCLLDEMTTVHEI